MNAKATHTLTPRQADLLAFLRSRGDMAPTYDEMAAGIGIRSKGNIPRLIDALEERGYISRLPNRARALRLLDVPPRELADYSTDELMAELNRRLKAA